MMVVEDLLSILLLAVMTGVASGSKVSAGRLAITLGELGGLLVAMVVVGMFVVPRTIRVIARFKRSEPLMVASLAICFATVWVAVHAGYSLALGAFVGGMLIAESGKGHDVDVLIRPFRDIFAAIFFISIGLTIAPTEIADHWLASVFIAVLLVVAKTLGISIAAFLTGNGLRRSVQAGLTLSQIGEFAFIVIGLGVSTGAVRSFLLPVVVGASCLTALTGAWQIRASDRFASWIDAHLPRPMQTFVSFYESWIARLRAEPSPDSVWLRVRRPLIMLLVDAIAVAAIVIAATELHGAMVALLVDVFGLGPKVALAIVIALAVALASLFALGIARGAVRMAWLLAAIVIPRHVGKGDLDLGLAPRRALVLTLELAIVLTVGLPLAAVAEPLVPGGAILVLGAITLLAFATKRSINDFDRHVRAGSALIVEVLARQSAEREPPHLAEVETMLPGFGGVTPISLGASATAIGKTLAELDLRMKTGASVLAMTREGAGILTPSPTEPLRQGDVLALAGSAEAIAAARQLLLELLTATCVTVGTMRALIVVPMCSGVAPRRADGVDENLLLACRPTLACTAEPRADRHCSELELGGQPRDPSGSALVTTIPFLFKLPVAHWLELQVSSNGFTYSSPVSRYVDNIFLGTKLHLADQATYRPALAITAAVGIPNPPQRGYVRVYDATLTGAASKDLAPLHFDFNLGVELFQIDASPTAQLFTALAATYPATKQLSVAFEPHYFAAASTFASRDVGVMGAVEYSVRTWLVFDAALDVTFLEPRAVTGLFGVSIAPVRIWGH